MRSLYLLFCFVVLSHSVSGQVINRILPVRGFDEIGSDLQPVPGGFVTMISHLYPDVNNFTKSHVALLDSTGIEKWISPITSAPNEGFIGTKLLPLSDGRVILVGTVYYCNLNNAPVRLIMFSATGDILWDKRYHVDTESNVNWFPSRNAYADENNNLVVVPIYNLPQRLLIRIDDGNLIRAEPARFIDAIPIAGHPGLAVVYEKESDKVLIVKGDSIISVFQDTSRYDYYPVNIKTYKDPPQIVINHETHISCFDLDGNFSSTLLAYNSNITLFSAKDGKYLAGYSHYSAKWVKIYEKQGTLYDEISVLYLPALKNLNVNDIHWSDNNIIFEGYYNTHDLPEDYTGSSTYQSFRYAFTLDVTTGKMSIPKSDVALTNVEFDQSSWWYDQDTLLPAFFKPGKVSFTLKNKGLDTLQSAIICFRRFPLPNQSCFENTSYYKMLDHLAVVPGDTTVVTLDDIPLSITDPLNFFDSLCFWVALPNNHIEDNQENNTFCRQPDGYKLPSPGQMHVFPNPVGDQLFVLPEKTGYTKAKVQILTLTGQVLFDEYVSATADYFIVNTAFLRPGLYVIRVGNDVFKIIKE